MPALSQASAQSEPWAAHVPHMGAQHISAALHAVLPQGLPSEFWTVWHAIMRKRAARPSQRQAAPEWGRE
jgi:hypothetical protein